MKDLSSASKILGMEIQRNRADRAERNLLITQSDYLNKVVKRYCIDEAKSVKIPFFQHVRLSKVRSPKIEEETAAMVKVPYSSAWELDV